MPRNVSYFVNFLLIGLFFVLLRFGRMAVGVERIARGLLFDEHPREDPGRGEERDRRDKLADADAGGEQVQAVGAQALDPDAAKAVPRNIQKEDLAVEFPLFREDMQADEADEIVYKCNCGYEKREPSEQLEHELETLYDAAQHWKVCKVCKEEIEGSRGEHSYHWSSVWNDWTCDCGAMHSEVCRGHMTALTDRCTCSREVLQCSKCGTEFERKERGAFSSYPHHYDENGVCTDCGAQNPEIPETPDKPDPDQPDPDNPDNPNPDTPDPDNPNPDTPNPDNPEPDNPDPGQDAGSETEDTQEDA